MAPRTEHSSWGGKVRDAVVVFGSYKYGPETKPKWPERDGLDMSKGWTVILVEGC